MSVPFDRWLKRFTAALHLGFAKGSGSEADAAIVAIEGDGASLLVRRRGKTAAVAKLSAGDAGFVHAAEQLARRGRVPESLLLRFPEASVLRKRLTVPAAARRHLESMLGFEMDRETPYSRDEVHWSYKIRGNAAPGKLAVDLVLVPRALVDPLVESARRAGFEIAGLEAAAGPEDSVQIRLGPHNRWQWLREQRPVMALAATAAALALIAVATPFLRMHRASAEVEARIEALTPQATEAAKLRQSIDRLASVFEYLKQERERSGSPLAALAAATRAIPDDTYLTNYDMRGARLTLTGLSPSAARLVGTLAKSAEFGEPAFEAPVVQNADEGLEAFTISVSLKSDGLKSAGKNSAEPNSATSNSANSNPAGAP